MMKLLTLAALNCAAAVHVSPVSLADALHKDDVKKQAPPPIDDSTVDHDLIPDEPKGGGGDEGFGGFEDPNFNPLENGPHDAAGPAVPKGPLKDVQIQPPATLKPGTVVALKGGKHGKYCADENHHGRIICNRGAIGGWEKFTIVAGPNGKVGLKGGREGKFCADEGHRIICNRNWVRGWEQFQVVPAGPGRMALQGGRNKKFCADEGNTVKCNRDKVQNWEKFQVQVLGNANPAQQMCVRPPGWCSHAGAQYWAHFDCNGDGIPDPYCQDSKGQVGTILSGTCPIKWPGFDKAACKDAQGRNPPAPPVPMVMAHHRWVALLGGRANRWCADEGGRIICNRGAVKGWERFFVAHVGGDRFGLRGGRHNRWCADEHNTVRCNRPWVKGWEKFRATAVGGGRFGLMGGRGNRWCADEHHRVICNRGAVQGWERFAFRYL